MNYKVGFSKINFTPFYPGTTMLGYGEIKNKVRDVKKALFVRTCYIEETNSNKKMIFVNFELAFITQPVRDEILNQLRKTEKFSTLGDSEIIINAQHTHAGPSGFDHFFIYNVPNGGFDPRILKDIVNAGVRSIFNASTSITQAQLYYSEGDFANDKEVAFNRSLEAYIKNPEVDKNADHVEATDRKMKLLIAKKADQFLGCVSFFAIHCTSISPNNYSIHPDNKGIAATELEEKLGGVCVFAQGNAGDISPNYRINEKGKLCGKFDSQYESCEHNGKLQAEKALEIIKGELSEVSGKIRSVINFYDFSNIQVDEEFKYKANMKTSEPTLGISFIEGTKEGPGAPKALSAFVKLVSRLINFSKSKEQENFMNSQYPKDPFIQTSSRKILGIKKYWNLPIPRFVDPLWGELLRLTKTNAISENSWLAKHHSIQITELGNVVIVALPGETTNIAGKRLESLVAKFYPNAHIILAPYSNSYCGYITTPQEYEVQCYEGGHTLFGINTLGAFQTKTQELLESFTNEEVLEQNFKLPKFSNSELDKRSVNPT